ncbi:transposase domain-containing protein [Streptomyces sp. NPDC051286]|uniref:transposase domain-containing protein n=1 Tax=Streptomyces sp. NPDC051286 TaxID=3365647 RepID=UPI0037B4EFD8
MPSAITEGSQAPSNRLVAPSGRRFGEHVRLGMLTEEIRPELVDEVVELTGCGERRRRLLPARAVVYFVLALSLFSSSDSAGPPGYRSVLRTLTEKLRHLPGLCVQHLPTSSALTRARQRLGDKPLQVLFERRCGTLATTLTPCAFAFGLRLVAWDGTALDVPDTPANAAEFGFTGKGGSVRPPVYLDNLFSPWNGPALVNDGVLAYPLPAGQRAAWMSHADLAQVLAAATEAEGLVGRAVDVGGADVLTGTELAAAFANALGREVRYLPLGVEDFEAGLGQLLGAESAAGVAGIYHHVAAGDQELLAAEPATTERVFGVQLTSTVEWVKTQNWEIWSGRAA